MKIRSAVPENGCLIFLTDGKKTKKNKKTSAKHIRIRLLPEGGCVNKVNYILHAESSYLGAIFTLWGLRPRHVNALSRLAIGLAARPLTRHNQINNDDQI